MKFKVILLCMLYSFGFYASPIYSYFYSVAVMENQATEKTVILLSDVHQISAVTGRQQNEVINLVKKLQEKGDEVHVLVEDLASFKKPTKYTICPPKTPLSYLIKKCEEVNINTTNVEFRVTQKSKHITKCHKTIEDIKKTTDPVVLEKLRSYYRLIDSVDRLLDTYLDAYIVNNITSKTSNASTILVCAGGAHTASVSKILYQQGYKNTRVETSSNLPSFYKNMIYAFDKDEPLKKPGFSFPFSKDPLPLTDIQDKVLDMLQG